MLNYNFDNEGYNEKLSLRTAVILRVLIVAGLIALLLFSCKSSSPPTTHTQISPTPTEVTFELPFIDLDGVERTQPVTVLIDSIIRTPAVTVSPKKIVDRSRTKVVLRNVANNDTKIKNSDVGTLNQVDVTSTDSSAVTVLPNQTTTQQNTKTSKPTSRPSFLSSIKNVLVFVGLLVVLLIIYSLVKK